MPKLVNYENVKESIERSGYLLTSDEYISAHAKLSCVCPAGHVVAISWCNWKNGKRCAQCYNNRRSTPLRLDMADITKSFEDTGYKLITKEYRNAHQKLYYICPNGHTHYTRWNSWGSGHRCPTCAGQSKPQLNDIRLAFDKEGYTLLSEEYVNSSRKLEYVCPEGHKHSITWPHWNLSKHRCPVCRSANLCGEGHWNWKGGKTSKDVKIRCSPKYIEWRTSVFKRDNYICQMCSHEGGEIQAHHVFKFDNYALRRFEIWNGITLCKKCHRSIKGKEKEFVNKFLDLNISKYLTKKKGE